MVLGVGSVIKAHNRIVVMAIRLSRLIPQIIHQPVGPVSDHEEGCRWSGECRWLKRRELLEPEAARYANMLKCPILSIVLPSKFFVYITDQAEHHTELFLCSFIIYKWTLGSRRLSCCTTSARHLWGRTLQYTACCTVNGKEWASFPWNSSFSTILLQHCAEAVCML